MREKYATSMFGALSIPYAIFLLLLTVGNEKMVYGII